MLDWKHVSAVLLHPTALAILEELDQTPEASPRGLSETLSEPLGNVSYHVKRLLRAGLLELTRIEPVRGAAAHYYRLTNEARLKK